MRSLVEVMHITRHHRQRTVIVKRRYTARIAVDITHRRHRLADHHRCIKL